MIKSDFFSILRSGDSELIVEVEGAEAYITASDRGESNTLTLTAEECEFLSRMLAQAAADIRNALAPEEKGHE